VNGAQHGATTQGTSTTSTAPVTAPASGGAASAARQLDLVTLATWSDDQLEAALRKGTAPTFDSIAGWEFSGYNTPQITKLLGIRKFRKGFYRVPSGAVHGYNVKIEQNGGPLEPWVPVERGGEPATLGYYDVKPVAPGSKDALYPNALLLDYNSGRNPFYDPAGLLRDYLVQVDPQNPDLLLGKAYLALGPVRVPAGGYFILQRACRTFFAV
jgi:hypothetical protein